MNNFYKKIISLVLAVVTMPFLLPAATPTTEIPEDGQYDLYGETDRWQKITYENWYHNNEALKATQKIDQKKVGMRQTALNMAKQIHGLRDSSHADTLMDTQNSAFGLKFEANEDLKSILGEIFLSGYVDSQAELKIVAGKQPIWKVVKKSDGPNAFWNKRTQNLLVKVAFRARKAKVQDLAQFENIVRDISSVMMPAQMIKNFDTRKLASEIIQKAGIIEITDGITCRPTVPQDRLYAEYANLGSDNTDETLFWSDPAVSEGYHAIFGTAFNKTMLQGVKQVDIDNVVSRGMSEGITKFNQTKSESERMENPFKGISAKIIPGLIVMGEQGRLTPYEDPNKDQIDEAKKLTQTLRMLPSQCMKPVGKKVSAPLGDRVISPLQNFKFSYPARIIRVQSTERTKEQEEEDARLASDPNVADQTYDVSLSKLDGKVYDNVMKLNKKRLLEIARLKDANLRGRRYLNAVIESYVQMESDAANVANGMNKDSSIPQITQLRKDIFTALEETRWRLSELHYQYDDLKQKEWEVLSNILHTEHEYILKLMDQAAVRYRTTIQDIEKGINPP